MSTPDLFTVAEAAVVLRIGRTTAYELVRRDFASGGGEGLAVVRIGGQFRVPRAALERIVGGPVSWPPEWDPAPVEDGSAAGKVVPLPGAAEAPVKQSSGRPWVGSTVVEPTLPFPS